MKNLPVVLILTLLLASCSTRTTADLTLYENAQVYSGKGFEKKSFYVQNGLFTFNPSGKPMQVIDLEGKYVVPPFGDAHTHNFDDPATFDSIYKAYIKEGVFYVKVLNNHHSNFLFIKDSLNQKGKIDVAFAHGGLTATGGHPHNLYESQALNYSWRAMFDPDKKVQIKASKIKRSDAYYTLDTPAEVEDQWASILSKNPDFLKVYLLRTKDRETKINKGEIGTYGLSKEVLYKVVEKAKQANLSLTAHVETLDDFELALDCGIRQFGHMPGYGGGIGNTPLGEMALPDSLLLKLSELEVTITPTVSFAKYYSQAWDGTKMALDTNLLEAKQTFLRTEIRKLYDNGVTITLGADQHLVTLKEEIDDIIALEVFSPTELLNILTQTPQSIFPSRKIGRIEEGFEGSFLVLKENPLERIEAIYTIENRVKNGVELSP